MLGTVSDKLNNICMPYSVNTIDQFKKFIILLVFRSSLIQFLYSKKLTIYKESQASDMNPIF